MNKTINTRLANKHTTIFWFTLSLVFILLNSVNALDSDEGVILEGAWAIHNDKTPYIDFFEIITPGSFYINYLAWLITGPSYLASKTVGITCLMLAAVGSYASARLITGRESKYNLISPIFICLSSSFWPTINHNTYNITLLIWATYFHLLFLSGKSERALVYSGFLTGFAFLFLQHKSLLFFIATIGFHVARGSNRRIPTTLVILRYTGTFLLPIILLMKWPPDLLAKDLFIFPANNYVAVNKTSLLPFWFALTLTFFTFLPTIKSRNKKMTYMLALQCLMLPSALQRTDITHVSLAMFPTIIAIAPYLLDNPIKISTSSLARLIPAVTFLTLTAVSTSTLAYNASAVIYDNLTGNNARNNARKVLSFIQQLCPTLYAGPFTPGLYFETRTINPTPYSVLLTGFNTQLQFEDAVRHLEKSKPKCAIIENNRISIKYHHTIDNPVEHFIQSNYKHAYNFGAIDLYLSLETNPQINTFPDNK